MEKRSRRRVPELVTRLAFQGLSENEIGRARISMMARNANVPFKGRIQKRKTYHLQIITFGLQCAAGPYSWVISHRSKPGRRSPDVRFAPIASELSHRSETTFSAISRHQRRFIRSPRRRGRAASAAPQCRVPWRS